MRAETRRRTRASPSRLNLGCGKDARPGWLNVDVDPSMDPDVVVDLEQTPWPWETSSVEHILLSHVLEHLSDVPATMDEAHRILEPDGILVVEVPHYTSPNAYQDPTHQQLFTVESMDYFLEDVPDHLHPLSERRWRILHTELKGGWRHTLPAADHLYRHLGIDLRKRYGSIRWTLTPVKEERS